MELLNAPDITTTQGLRDHAIILAVLLDGALRRCEVAALTDGRSSGGFTPEAAVAARHARMRRSCRCSDGTLRVCDLRPCSGKPPIRKLAAPATDNGLLAPELAAGIARVKSAKSISVASGKWLTLRQARALLNAPDIMTTKAARYAGPRWRRSRYPTLVLKTPRQPVAASLRRL